MPGFHRLSLLLLLTLLLAACGSGTYEPDPDEPAPIPTDPALLGLSGEILIDGSSTVFPITEIIAESFRGAGAQQVKIPIGASGTGGGFKKLCAGEIVIANASRPIKAEEIELCNAGGVEFIELPVAYDGLSVLVNPVNEFASCLTTDELKRLWAPEAEEALTSWRQLRPEFPDEEISLYGPGTDSGTFDYFTAEITGEEGASRGDFTASEDDNTLVQGIASDAHALGYFGYAYYIENQDLLKVLQVDAGEGCVAPSPETIATGSYKPLSRPLFIYVSTAAAGKPELKAFLDFYLTHATALVGEVGYVALPPTTLALVRERWTKGTTGTVFSGANGTVDELLKQ